MTLKWWKHCTVCLWDYFCHHWWENCSVSLLSSLSTSAHSGMPKANHLLADQRSWQCWCGSARSLVAWTTLSALPKSIVQVPSSVYCLYTCETGTGKCLWPLGKKASRSLLWYRVSKTAVTVKQHREVLEKYVKRQFYCYYETCYFFD